jgi:hypothetical protein
MECPTDPGHELALSWASDRLEEWGRSRSRAPELVKDTYVGTVLRLPTDAGDAWLKILPGVFIREIEITEKLREWGVAELPRRIAVDVERGLMLTEDMGGHDLADDPAPELVARAARTFAEFQLATLARVDHERPYPLYDWRIEVLADRARDLPGEAEGLLAGSPDALSEAEAEGLRRVMPGWLDLCARIRECGVPDAIDHGDLRPGNIRVVGDRIVVYDWAWSAVTHPFFALASLLHHAGGGRLVADAYLEVWSGVAPLDELRRAFGLVERAWPLYGAVADAAWLEVVSDADADTRRWRQHYFARMVRRLLAAPSTMSP